MKDLFFRATCGGSFVSKKLQAEKDLLDGALTELEELRNYDNSIQHYVDFLNDKTIKELNEYKKAFELVLNQLSKYEYANVDWLAQARKELENDKQRQKR